MIARILSGAALAAAVVGAAQAAQDLPKRKAGLWEIQTQMQGVPAMTGPVQMCTDEKSDDIMHSRAEAVQPNCKSVDWKKDGDRVTVNSVCKMDETTMTTAAVFTGSFESSYRGDLRMTYDPPMGGLKQMNMTISAKWLGPCKPGQKPGDVVVQNKGAPAGMNRKDLMKLQKQMMEMDAE